jgi:hypothetical protein
MEARGRRYIRFGDIPEGERSGVYAQAHMLSRQFTPGDMEKGVSVFDAEWSEERQRWMIVDVGNYASLDALLGQRRPAFLATSRLSRRYPMTRFGYWLMATMVRVKNISSITNDSVRQPIPSEIQHNQE